MSHLITAVVNMGSHNSGFIVDSWERVLPQVLVGMLVSYLFGFPALSVKKFFFEYEVYL